MSDAVYAFDVDDCLEIGGQIRLPSTFGPVTIASIRTEAAPPDGDICGIVGNWVNLPSLVPDWREFLSFLLPPVPSSSPKAFWLAWVRAQYPGYRHYVMVGNDPTSHATRPAYWGQQWPGTLPVTHVPGDHLLSNDIGAAAEAGFEFIREDEWAAGRRIGVVPPPPPGRPLIQFPKHARPPMIEKVFQIPDALKSANADSGIVEAIVSVTGNLDLQKDIIVPGAYAKVLAGDRLPKVVKQHNWGAWLGKTVDAEELMPGSKVLPQRLQDNGWGGLYVKGEFTMEDPAAAAVFAHLKRGAIDEFSVGFDIDTDDKGDPAVAYDDETDIRRIKSIFPLYEWSPVMMGANPETLPVGIKAADLTLAEAEFSVLTDGEKMGLYYETLDLPEEQLSLKAKWSRAFINKLPDSAFALILAGGKKDSSGRTVPRSLRKLPHHGQGGSVDPSHLANALSRAAQQPALKSAVPHLRKHARAMGMGKYADSDRLDNVAALVTEQQLMVAMVGVSVAVAHRARRHTTM